MNLHYKNMRQLCEHTDTWVKRNLSHLGIDQFGCNFIDLKKNTYFPLACHYQIYCEYMEKKHHLNMASRIQTSIRNWNNNESLYQIYEHEAHERNIDEPIHMFDWTVQTKSGFELFYITSHQPLLPKHLLELKQWMHIFSYQGSQMSKYKPKALLNLENQAALSAKYQAFTTSTQDQTSFKYQKAKFDELVLTGKEQEYIEHLVMRRTQKEIANRHQVTETAVRNVICNIKRKLGSEYITTTQMFSMLNECGALAACMSTVHQF